jgi:hypothetical protein
VIATAPPALDAAQRSALERLVIRARGLLESDLAAQAEGRYGIHLNGTIEDEAALPDDTTDKVTRRELEQIVAHLRTLGEDPPSAVARLLREAAFTHLNRLVAIRIAETIGLLPESLANGPQSRGFKDLGEIMPMLAGDFRTYIRLCGDELASDAPALFDPRNPLLTLQPTTAAFDELVALLADPNASEIWSAPDTLGWAYQFFNTAEERREMRQDSAPRNSHELAVRNQFFTPRYVVDFLVQNTLGRRLIETDPRSPLLEMLPLLVDPPSERRAPLDLTNLAVLDPACGSGHFLLGCYDLLERAWEVEGVSKEDAAARIVDSLWGLDIDSRCAQVASAAIMLRARQSAPTAVLPRPHAITARSLPSGAMGLDVLLQSLPIDRREMVRQISRALNLAPVLGPLLKIDETFGFAIRQQFALPDALRSEDFDEAEADVMRALANLADAASSTTAERLLAAEAQDAIRFVDALRRRYDCVLMNPPFGTEVPESKEYLRGAYHSCGADVDLFAAFVVRGLELCKPDGYMGAITSRAGMFLTTFERWRQEVFFGHQLTAVADLGFGVMAQALVEAAAYVVGAGAPLSNRRATFIRLLKDTDRPTSLASAAKGTQLGVSSDSHVFRIALADLEGVPGRPIAYWLSPSIRRLFTDLPRLEANGATVRKGLSTGDDFRFLRLFWEVPPERIGRGREQTQHGSRWVPFAKGGEYSPFWGDIHLVVDWANDGSHLKEFAGAYIRSQQLYFRSGITWSDRTASGFSARVLPIGCIFSHKGPAAIVASDTLPLALGWMNSRIVQALLSASLGAGDETTSGTASKSYEIGIVQKLPWPLVEGEGAEIISAAASRATNLTRQAGWFDETGRDFLAPGLCAAGKNPLIDQVKVMYAERCTSVLAIIEASYEIEHQLSSELGLDADANTYLDVEVGRHPATYSDSSLIDEERFARLFQSPIDRVVDELIAEKGGSRSIATLTFVADRRLEVLAHGLERHPSVLVSAINRLGILPPEEPRGSVSDLFSYLVGVAFGRWDARAGRAIAAHRPPPDLSDPLPIYPPGMLVDPSGSPARVAPDGYLFDLPPSGLLVDEAGQQWDIERRISAAAEMLFDGSDDVIQQMLPILGYRTIREYLRKQFFKDHLSRYSKSRRKGPIYWSLTVPSKNWGVWIYAPILTREMLYAVAAEAARRERLAGEVIARLDREKAAGAAKQTARRIAEELDAEEKLLEELRRFRAEAERVAGIGWTPELDDGIIMCAAPLADLFPSWPDAMTAREELRKGGYAWTTVAAWADQL